MVHGPEAVYSGEAHEIISFLCSLGDVRAIAGGTMCRTAVIDLGLEREIVISRCDMPSVALNSLGGCSALVLVNHGKNLESGIAFGEIVAGRTARAVVQVERAGERDGRVIVWNPDPPSLAAADVIGEHFSIAVERRHTRPMDGRKESRAVRSAVPGEPLFIDHIFVGTVTSTEVVIHAKDGRICGIDGVRVKEEGLSKVGQVDLGSVLVKSGLLRERPAEPSLCRVREGSGRMMVIDHRAYGALEVPDDAVCALTVGDDTTEVAGDVLARLGVRIIGITDADKDAVLVGPVRAHGSAVFRVKGITDDHAGAMVGRALNGDIDHFDGFVAKTEGLLRGKNIIYERII